MKKVISLIKYVVLLFIRIPIVFFYPKGKINRLEFIFFYLVCEVWFLYFLDRTIGHWAWVNRPYLANFLFENGIYHEKNTAFALFIFRLLIPSIIFSYALWMIYKKRFNDIGNRLVFPFLAVFMAEYLQIVFVLIDSAYLVNFTQPDLDGYVFKDKYWLYLAYKNYFYFASLFILAYCSLVRDREWIKFTQNKITVILISFVLFSMIYLHFNLYVKFSLFLVFCFSYYLVLKILYKEYSNKKEYGKKSHWWN